VHKFGEIVKHEMETAISLAVPLKVDWNYGTNWYEAH
jgi:DNA polymerase I-like protein with 3'-5' exonuclease and polymerase domains